MFLVPSTPHISRNPGDEADLEDVVGVGGEGKLAFLCLLTVYKVLALGVRHHHVHLANTVSTCIDV